VPLCEYLTSGSLPTFPTRMTLFTLFGISLPPIYGHMQNERSSSFAADCPASDCADRPLSGRDFASPATSSANHSRGNLTAGVSGIQSKGNRWKMKMNAATVFRNLSLDFRKSVAPQYVHGFAGLRNSKGRPVPRRPRRLAGLTARC
jgi:hypothetical protein